MDMEKELNGCNITTNNLMILLCFVKWRCLCGSILYSWSMGKILCIILFQQKLQCKNPKQVGISHTLVLSACPILSCYNDGCIGTAKWNSLMTNASHIHNCKPHKTNLLLKHKITHLNNALLFFQITTKGKS